MLENGEKSPEDRSSKIAKNVLRTGRKKRAKSPEDRNSKITKNVMRTGTQKSPKTILRTSKITLGVLRTGNSYFKTNSDTFQTLYSYKTYSNLFTRVY